MQVAVLLLLFAVCLPTSDAIKCVLGNLLGNDFTVIHSPYPCKFEILLRNDTISAIGYPQERQEPGGCSLVRMQEKGWIGCDCHADYCNYESGFIKAILKDHLGSRLSKPDRKLLKEMMELYSHVSRDSSVRKERSRLDEKFKQKEDPFKNILLVRVGLFITTAVICAIYGFVDEFWRNRQAKRDAKTK